MRLHRFILDIDLSLKKILVSDLELLNQWRNVLRLKVGEEVILSDGNLNEVRGKILKLSSDMAFVQVLEKWKNEAEPEIELTLYLSLLKKENFEWAAEKVTEIGVRKIIPIITERTVKMNLNKERLQKIVREAAEQSGRGLVPEIHEVVKFEEALEEAKKDNGVNLIFEPEAEVVLDSSLRWNDKKKLGVFIGPEGGWSEKELDLARQCGARVVSMGKLTYRAETAAIVASSLLLNI